MSRWENNKEQFDYVGRYGDIVSYTDLPSKLRLKAVAEEFGGDLINSGRAVVCGSPGETSNDPLNNNVFHPAGGEYRFFSQLICIE